MVGTVGALTIRTPSCSCVRTGSKSQSWYQAKSAGGLLPMMILFAFTVMPRSRAHVAAAVISDMSDFIATSFPDADAVQPLGKLKTCVFAALGEFGGLDVSVASGSDTSKATWTRAWKLALNTMMATVSAPHVRKSDKHWSFVRASKQSEFMKLSGPKLKEKVAKGSGNTAYKQNTHRVTTCGRVIPRARILSVTIGRYAVTTPLHYVRAYTSIQQPQVVRQRQRLWYGWQY